MAVPSDFVVEVRDVNYVRQGQIDPVYLDLKYSEVFRSVGKWELKLPAEHPLLPKLKAKGSGIIVTRKGSSRPFSGRMQSCTLSQDATDPAGTWVISGVDDNVIAAATVTFPNPSQAANAQTTDYWTYTAAGETVMKQLVVQNIGANAQAARKYSWLSVTTDQSRGQTISASTRFDNLGDALTALGTRANLGWRFYQSGTGIFFDVFQPQDKTGLIRLNIRNGGLESTELGYSAPTATQALVLGQGEGAARTVRPVTSTASLAEATSWGLRWEVVKDERNTDDPTELDQAGQEILTEQGSTVNSLKITPSDAPKQKVGVDWDLGDTITVIIDDQPTTAIVTEVARSVTSAGVITQVTVGDPVGFDWEAQVGKTLSDQDSRISFLEATIGTSVKDPKFNTLRLTSTSDVSLSSTGHGFQIGPDNGYNLAMDQNEIMARNNGATSSLYLQGDGGDLGLGTAASTVSLPGRLNAAHLPWAEAVGSGTQSGSLTTGSGVDINITFPTGRFTVAPRVFASSDSPRVTIGVTNVTATGAQIRLYNWSGATASGPIPYYWEAKQMTSSAANG